MGQIENAKLLLSKLDEKEVADIIQSKNKTNGNCMIEAAKNGHVGIMEFVLSKLNRKEDKLRVLMDKDDQNRNAFDTACINGHAEAAEFVLSQLNDREKAKEMIKAANALKVSDQIALNLKIWEDEFC